MSDTHLQRTINNHANLLRSLIQTVSTLMQVLKETRVLVPSGRRWWQFWKPKYIMRVGVFSEKHYDGVFAVLLAQAEVEKNRVDLVEAEAIHDTILNAGPDSPIYSPEGAHFERTARGKLRLKKG